MQRRIAAVVTIVVGIALIVTTFANSLFSVGPAFEEMVDDFRPIMTDEAIATARADLQLLGDATTEITTAAIPALAQQLGTDPAGFQAIMAQQFPDVATGLEQLPSILPTFNGLIDTLDEQQENFASADEIPTKDLPATTVPWGLLLVGLAAIGTGVFMWFRSRLGSFIALGLGVAVVVVSLLFSLLGKAGDADDLNDALEPVYTVQTVDGASAALIVVQDMGNEMNREMLPFLAQQLGMQPEELQAFLGTSFPSMAAALGSMPDALARFELLSDTFRANLDNYDTLQPVRFSPIVITLVIGGVVIALAGIWALFARNGEPSGPRRHVEKKPEPVATA